MSTTNSPPTKGAGPAPGFAQHAGYQVELVPVTDEVTIHLDGEIICRTSAALRVQETRHAPALYVPLADVAAERLLPSTTQTYCPFKGTASYHGIRTAQANHPDVLWEYAEPFDEVVGLGGYAGVYVGRVDDIREAPGTA